MQQNDIVKISESLQDMEWDDYVSTVPGGHHAQTSRWAQVKTLLGWKVKRIVVYQGNRVGGGAQVLIRKLPMVGNASYITKGPLCDPQDGRLTEILIDHIIQICRQDNCQLIAVQPPNNGTAIGKQLEANDFCESRLQLAPTASLVIDLQPGLEVIMKQMHKKVRQHIRRSENAGIIVSEGTQTDLEPFYRCYLETARRQKFTPFKREYFDLLWKTFSPPGWILLLIARYQKEVVTTQLLIPFGDTVITKMIGWSGEYDHFRPNEAVYWAGIRWACEHGYRYFDFEGLNLQNARKMVSGKALVTGEDIFKYGFGGQVVFFPPAYDYVPNQVLNLIYRSMPPEMEGNSISSRLVEYFRKR